MIKLFRFFIGFCVTWGICVIVWELIKLALGEMGSFGHSNITRNIFMICIGVFFSIGYTGFVYYMVNDKLKTTRYKNIVFTSVIIFSVLCLARAVCFNYDKIFSTRLIWFTVGLISAAAFWFTSKPETNLNNLTDAQLRKYNRFRF